MDILDMGPQLNGVGGHVPAFLAVVRSVNSPHVLPERLLVTEELVADITPNAATSMCQPAVSLETLLTHKLFPTLCALIGTVFWMGLFSVNS